MDDFDQADNDDIYSVLESIDETLGLILEQLRHNQMKEKCDHSQVQIIVAQPQHNAQDGTCLVCGAKVRRLLMQGRCAWSDWETDD